jgi:hypothetical protein
MNIHRSGWCTMQSASMRISTLVISLIARSSPNFSFFSIFGGKTKTVCYLAYRWSEKKL